MFTLWFGWKEVAWYIEGKFSQPIETVRDAQKNVKV